MTKEEADRLEEKLRRALPELRETLRKLEEAKRVRPETMLLQFTF